VERTFTVRYWWGFATWRKRWKARKGLINDWPKQDHGAAWDQRPVPFWVSVVTHDLKTSQLITRILTFLKVERSWFRRQTSLGTCPNSKSLTYLQPHQYIHWLCAGRSGFENRQKRQFLLLVIISRLTVYFHLSLVPPVYQWFFRRLETVELWSWPSVSIQPQGSECVNLWPTHIYGLTTIRLWCLKTTDCCLKPNYQMA